MKLGAFEFGLEHGGLLGVMIHNFGRLDQVHQIVFVSIFFSQVFVLIRRNVAPFKIQTLLKFRAERQRLRKVHYWTALRIQIGIAEDEFLVFKMVRLGVRKFSPSLSLRSDSLRV